MTQQAKDKAKFRSTSKWKNWRKYLKSTRKKDALTLKPLLKGFQVHHMDLNEKNYQILTEDRFEVLNRESHEVLHFLFRYYLDDPEIIERLKALLNKMKELNNE